MIGMLTHHWAKADRVGEAKKLLDGNGLAQSKTRLCKPPDPLLDRRSSENHHAGGVDEQRHL